MDLQFYRKKWHEIHSKAAEVVRGERSHRRYLKWVRDMPNDLPCKICRHHARDYIRNNPPEFSQNLFFWSWQFHNAVNTRKGKPLVSYEEAAHRHGV